MGEAVKKYSGQFCSCATIIMGSHTYTVGQPIVIVKGNYKSFGNGIYIGSAGRISARIKIDSDTCSERTLRLDSIRPKPPDKGRPSGSNNPSDRSAHSKELVKLNRQQFKTLITDIDSGKVTIDEITTRLRRMAVDEL
jgi:hypothetical protein